MGLPSGQAEAFVVVDGLGQSRAQSCFAAILGEVKKVVARVSHGQIVLPAGSRLDDDAQT